MKSSEDDGHSRGPTAEATEAFEVAARMLVGLAVRSLAEVAGNAVSIPQFRLLLVLAERGSLPSSQAAAALRLNASSVTRLADRLENAGLLMRTRERTNRSVVAVSLTAEGEELVQRVLTWRREALAHLLGQLDPEAVASAASTVRQLTALAAGDSLLGGAIATPHG